MAMDKIANRRLRGQQTFAVDLINESEKWCKYVTGEDVLRDHDEGNPGSNQNQNDGGSSSDDVDSTAEVESLDDEIIEAWQYDPYDTDHRRIVEDQPFAH